MTYKQLSELLPNDELHYIQDAIDTDPNLEQYKENKFVLYEFVCECIPETLRILTNNNIPFIVGYDDCDMLYIVILENQEIHYPPEFETYKLNN
jgi:hypothetical protein